MYKEEESYRIVVFLSVDRYVSANIFVVYCLAFYFSAGQT